jgi:hypothetical protein
MVAVFINLDDSDPENGGLGVFPGSHKLGPLPNISDSDTHFYVDQVHCEAIGTSSANSSLCGEACFEITNIDIN